MKPDFTGTWQLAAAASDFAFLKPPLFRVDVIEHSGSSVRITTRQQDDNGDHTVVRELVIGAAEATPIDVLGRPRLYRANWDGDALVVSCEWVLSGKPRRLTDRWTLSTDGSVITIDRRHEVSGGPVRQRLVMQRGQ